jgi:hypothetical protein
VAILEFLLNTLDLALEAAPWLLLGLVVAGLLKAWMPTSRLARRLGHGGLGAVTRAAIVGAPLPLCSCGVLPAAFGLRRAGASRPATVSFLISTPETGVDSIAVSYVLLGPVFAVVRPVAAVLSALLTGLAVAFATAREEEEEHETVQEIDLYAQEDDDCCGTEAHGHAAAAASGFVPRTLAGLGYAFSDLIDEIALWLAVGIVVAGLVVTLVPPDLLAAWGRGPIAMLAVLAVSVPMYVCATASTPMALAMLHAGVSPGTALVFLLAGPATNVAGLVLIRKELGNATMAVYLAGVAVCSIAAGLALDAAWAGLGGAATVPLEVGWGGGAVALWIGAPSLALLTLCALKPVRAFVWRRLEQPAPSHG